MTYQRPTKVYYDGDHSVTTARQAVLVIIGVMLGTTFSPGMSGDLLHWGASLIIMLLATAVMMAISVGFSRRVAGYSADTALYAGFPGASQR
ncbi:putative ammonia monooxygenase [Halomonas elongata]|uniref:Putative ammonia monooxygenase n=1 Tax=Halomonas elongata TaxID=2746 RepID=A0A1B8P618_HALEL|nr:putative ammonia monooxygenase [Halomonas elongata]